jgi:6-phosphogluconate dehydrogenase
MVHNGIEYGLMQLIAETYDLMKRGLGLGDDKLHDVYSAWNEAELESYLVDITSKIFVYEDEETGRRLIDVILDAAKQKGTGKWTSQDAMDLQAPVPTIDVAVTMRNLSAMDPEREEASKMISGPEPQLDEERDAFIQRLRRALYAAMIITYAQGMDQLQVASEAYEYDLDLEAIATIWRGGCIIRAALLEKIRSAYGSRPDLQNLLVDPALGALVEARQQDLREVVTAAAEIGVPAPGLMVSLAYFDGYRSAWLPANLIQAQRDYFGSHTYERIDQKGQFHTEWQKSEGG